MKLIQPGHFVKFSLIIWKNIMCDVVSFECPSFVCSCWIYNWGKSITPKYFIQKKNWGHFFLSQLIIFASKSEKPFDAFDANWILWRFWRNTSIRKVTIFHESTPKRFYRCFYLKRIHTIDTFSHYNDILLYITW